jgi:CRP/FNR family transcriptional regulator
MNPLCHGSETAAGGAPPVERRRRVEAGDRLFAIGTPRSSVYALRAGFVKIVAPDAGSGQHIVRFLLPGDVAGLDAFAEGVHENEAVALQDCQVCEIPAHRVEALAQYNARLAQHLRKLLARELSDAQGQAVALSRFTAAQRVARFLLELSRRWGERGFSGVSFSLPMGRREIGDHLGLTMETVSRILSDFQAHGWVALPRRGIEIRDAEALQEILRMSHHEPPAPPLPARAEHAAPNA